MTRAASATGLRRPRRQPPSGRPPASSMAAVAADRLCHGAVLGLHVVQQCGIQDAEAAQHRARVGVLARVVVVQLLPQRPPGPLQLLGTAPVAVGEGAQRRLHPRQVPADRCMHDVVHGQFGHGGERRAGGVVREGLRPRRTRCPPGRASRRGRTRRRSGRRGPWSRRRPPARRPWRVPTPRATALSTRPPATRRSMCIRFFDVFGSGTRRKPIAFEWSSGSTIEAPSGSSYPGSST